jgi:hypothetical protein
VKGSPFTALACSGAFIFPLAFLVAPRNIEKVPHRWICRASRPRHSSSSVRSQCMLRLLGSQLGGLRDRRRYVY